MSASAPNSSVSISIVPPFSSKNYVILSCFSSALFHWRKSSAKLQKIPLFKKRMGQIFSTKNVNAQTPDFVQENAGQNIIALQVVESFSVGVL
jgi:hypothetical protein